MCILLSRNFHFSCYPGFIEFSDCPSFAYFQSVCFWTWEGFKVLLIIPVIWINFYILTVIPYILESNPHPLYSLRGLKNQMRITIACGLDSRLRAGFWKNYGAAVRTVRTLQYNNLLFYLLLIIIYYSSDS